MHVLFVQIIVKPEAISAFIEATNQNASNSILEEGVLRFDFYQQVEDPTCFTLVEVYKTPEDHLRHRETHHYITWRDAVADWMAAPRVGQKYKNIFPVDADWKKQI